MKKEKFISYSLIFLFLFLCKISIAQINFFDKGLDAFERGKYDNAINFYTLYLENTESLNAYFNRGITYYKIKDYENAIIDFTKVIKEDPLDYEAYYNRGLAYFELDMVQKSKTDFKKVIHLHPDYDKAYLALGTCLAQQGKTNEALAYYDSTLYYNELNDNAHYKKALIYIDNDEPNMVLQEVNKAIQIDSSLSLYYEARADLHYKMNRLENSISDYTKAISLNPENETLYYNRGIAFYDNKQYGRAKKDFQYAVYKDKNDADAYWYLALSAKQTNDYEMAIAYYDKTLSINPDYPYKWSINKRQLRIKKWMQENMLYTGILIVLFISCIYFLFLLLRRRRRRKNSSIS